ncbi:RNA polymerase beta subunit, partial [Corchorus olitorius]
RPRIVLRSVDAVCIGGERVDVVHVFERDAEREQELRAAPATAAGQAWRNRHRAFAAGDKRHRRHKRRAVLAHLPRQRAVYLGDLARLAGHRIAEDGRSDAARRKYLRASLEALLRSGDNVIGHACKAGVAGLGCFGNLAACAAFEMRAHAIGHLGAPALEDGQRIGVGARIRHGRAAGNGARVVARHVRDDQRRDRRARCGGKPPALNARQ